MKTLVTLFILITSLIQTPDSSKLQAPFLEKDFIEVHKKYGLGRSYPVFGAKQSFNYGTVFQLKKDAPIVSIEKGKVTQIIIRKTGLGSHVVIEHQNGMTATYYHLKSIHVKKGQNINAGKKIGTAGSSGTVLTNGLGLKILIDDKVIDPLKVISL